MFAILIGSTCVSLFDRTVQFVLLSNGECQRRFLVVVRHEFDVADDGVEQMTLLAVNSWRVVLEISEVDVKMVERRLVVEVSANLTRTQVELRLDGFQTFASDVLQQLRVILVEVADGFDGSIVDDGQQIKRLVLSVPLEVRQENKSVCCVAILVQDSFFFLLVVQNVVHPVERELFAVQMRQRDGLINLWRFLNQVKLLILVLGDVLLGCWECDGDLQLLKKKFVVNF